MKHANAPSRVQLTSKVLHHLHIASVVGASPRLKSERITARSVDLGQESLQALPTGSFRVAARLRPNDDQPFKREIDKGPDDSPAPLFAVIVPVNLTGTGQSQGRHRFTDRVYVIF
jgi:hypothetical protein